MHRRRNCYTNKATIRRYIRAIHDSNLRAFCVESRPHPDFTGPFAPTLLEQYAAGGKTLRTFEDDRLIALVAVREGGSGAGELIDLSDAIGRGALEFAVPPGRWTLHVMHLTRNRGVHLNPVWIRAG